MVAMKVERKLFLFLRKWKHNEIMERKQNYAERKRKFLGRSENKNGMTFSGGTYAERKFLFLTNTLFSFYGCFTWPIKRAQYVIFHIEPLKQLISLLPRYTE
jgi:hypothetical protein